MKILYDRSNGLIERVVENTRRAYAQHPLPLSQTQRLLYQKILSKYIRKMFSRPECAGCCFSALGLFYNLAIRYWFEIRCEWPLPPYEALPYIIIKDHNFYRLLETIHAASTSVDAKITAAQQVRNQLFHGGMPIVKKRLRNSVLLCLVIFIEGVHFYVRRWTNAVQFRSFFKTSR